MRVTGALAELMSASGDTLRQAEIPEVSPHQGPAAVLTAGWVSARQSSISKMSSGLSPRWPQSRDMRTEWWRSSCRAEGCWQEGLPSPPLLFSGDGSPPHLLTPPCEQGTVLLQH